MRHAITARVLGSCLLLQATAGVAKGQAFTLAGKRILDPAGNDHVPRGANIGLWSDCSDAGTVAKIKNAWRFNTVRVYTRLAGDAANYPADAFMDRYVNAYTLSAPKVVVVFECHDFSGSYYRDTTSPSKADLLAFWRRAANRYKGNPYVWFNIMNEPGSGEGPVPVEYRDLHAEAIAAIRATGAGNIIVVDGFNWAAEDGGSRAAPVKDAVSGVLTYGPGLLDADPLRRVVFSLHCYDGWSYGPAKMDDYFRRVADKGLAMFVGEFASMPTESTRAVMLTATKHGLGGLVWHYIAWDGNPLCTAPWGADGGYLANASGGARPTNLTWLGERVWDFCNGAADSSQPAGLGIPLDRFAWTATASRGTPKNAIDGDPDSLFSIAAPDANDTGDAWLRNEWLRIDLGSVETFSKVLIDTRGSPAGFLRDFRLHAGNDAGTPGTLIADVAGNTMASPLVETGTRAARYLTLQPVKTGKSGYTYQSWVVADLLLFREGEHTPPAEATAELTRDGWTACANKRSGWSAEWEAKALDGNWDSRWTQGTAMADGDWFRVDMQAPRTFRTITFNTGKSGRAHPRRFEVYLSNDAANWGACACRGLGAPDTRVTFDSPRTARHIKVVCRESHAAEWWSIHEFRVFADAVPPCVVACTENFETASLKTEAWTNHQLVRDTTPASSATTLTLFTLNATDTKLALESQAALSGRAVRLNPNHNDAVDRPCLGYFRRATLPAAIGSAVVLTADVAFGSLRSAWPQYGSDTFRLGLYDSNGSAVFKDGATYADYYAADGSHRIGFSGYDVRDCVAQPNMTGNDRGYLFGCDAYPGKTSVRLAREQQNGTGLLTMDDGDFVALARADGTGAVQFHETNRKYAVEARVERVADGVAVELRVDGTRRHRSIDNSASRIETFDQVLFNSCNNNQLFLDNVRVCVLQPGAALPTARHVPQEIPSTTLLFLR